MLEIKTITASLAHHFDRAVNQALADGWELVRRECFITGSDRAATFYAELERIVEEPEEEDDAPGGTAYWNTARDPRNPYRCSACGYATIAKWLVCPECGRPMENAEG